MPEIINMLENRHIKYWNRITPALTRDSFMYLAHRIVKEKITHFWTFFNGRWTVEDLRINEMHVIEGGKRNRRRLCIWKDELHSIKQVCLCWNWKEELHKENHQGEQTDDTNNPFWIWYIEILNRWKVLKIT